MSRSRDRLSFLVLLNLRQRGLNNRQIAGLIGATDGAITRWMSPVPGIARYPNRTFRARLADLGVSLGLAPPTAGLHPMPLVPSSSPPCSGLAGVGSAADAPRTAQDEAGPVA